MSSRIEQRLPSPVGALLQQWRQQRNLSQLALATEAGISTRHLCFIETGRAKPSREMVLLLTDALDVPLRERNAFLLAAGFAPVYSQSDLEAPELAAARAALDALLRQQEPYPAVVLDRHWDVLRTNDSAQRLFAWLLDGHAPIAGAPNLLRLLFHPEGIRSYVVDWERTANVLLLRHQREALGGAPDQRSQELTRELLAYPNVPKGIARPTGNRPLVPILPVVFQKGSRRLEYFSTVTSLGTPQDVTLQEIRIECLFPVNAETEQYARAGLGASE